MQHDLSAFDAMLESTTFWVAISFVMFWVLAFKPALKASRTWLDNKIDKVSRDIVAAAGLRREAEDLLHDARARHDAAAGEASEITARAQAEAKALRQRTAVELQQSLERREQAAHARIAQLESQAAAALRQLTANVAIDAARALLASDLDDAARSQLTDSAIADLQKVA